jgi:hypothetical protein
MDVYVNAIRTIQVQPTIDLFAHSKNTKCHRFAALPGNLAGKVEILNAFSIRWTNELPYIFPPVQIIIPTVMQKIQEEKPLALVVVPHWPSQPWWGLFRPMARVILTLGNTKDILTPGPAMLNSSSQKKLPPGLLLMALVQSNSERTTQPTFIPHTPVAAPSGYSESRQKAPGEIRVSKPPSVRTGGVERSQG